MRDKFVCSARVALLVVLGLGTLSCRGEKHEPPEADAATRRTTQSGQVVGFHGSYGSDSWFGIPFAKPPVADLRWRAPQPPDSWTGVRPALAHGSACTQYGNPISGLPDSKLGEPTGSEDCLYLNIWTPRFEEDAIPKGDARLPVMVWIHGGGNSIGQGGFYDGGNLSTTGNLVIVSINYRLGPFGWFHNAALRGQDDLDRSGNYGTLDIVRALQWVRDNIAAFGGNPNNVTIFGESAGGANVYTMLLSPAAGGLFQRGIVESGGIFFESVAHAENFSDNTPAGDKNSSNELVARFLIQDGKAKDRAGAKQVMEGMSPDELAAYLRGKTNYEILRAYEPMPAFGMIDMPKLFADGAVLPTEDPMQLLASAGGSVGVPVITGTNHDENKLFMFGDPAQVRRILWIVPRLRDERMYNLSAEYLAKMWKATGADQPAAAMHSVQPNVYVYRFDWKEEPHVLGADLSVMLGASHGFEIPFVFGHFDLGKQGNVIFTSENEPGRKQLSAEMMSYWTEFARHGAPGRGMNGDLPQWEPAPAFMILDTPAGGGLRMSSDALTPDAVIAAATTDPRLSEPKDRCAILYTLASRSHGFTREQYEAKAECKEYPFASYPWT